MHDVGKQLICIDDHVMLTV